MLERLTHVVMSGSLPFTCMARGVLAYRQWLQYASLRGSPRALLSNFFFFFLNLFLLPFVAATRSAGFCLWTLKSKGIKTHLWHVQMACVHVQTHFTASSCFPPWNKRVVLPVKFASKLTHRPLPSSPQCGFFERAKYEDAVPSYNAVRIKREERAVRPGNGSWDKVEKKPWMTTWHDKDHYS